jgi:hypothetical protein
MVVMGRARRTCVRLVAMRQPNKFLSAMIAAKVERLPVALSAQRGRLIHRHTANRIDCHGEIVFGISVCSPLSYPTSKILCAERSNFGDQLSESTLRAFTVRWTMH